MNLRTCARAWLWLSLVVGCGSPTPVQPTDAGTDTGATLDAPPGHDAAVVNDAATLDDVGADGGSATDAATIPDANVDAGGHASSPQPVPTPDPSPAVTRSIGPAGGTITTRDGRVTVTIPAGALASATTIGIGYGSVTCPGGIGPAIHLTPDGLAFATPATLTVALDDALLSGTTLDRVGIAFQDDAGVWQAHGGTTHDGAAKTVSVPIEHFSWWSTFASWSIDTNGHPALLFTSQTLLLTAVELLATLPELPSDTLPIPDVAFPIETGGTPIVWDADGMGAGSLAIGTLSVLMGQNTTYQAPDHLPSTNPVPVHATMDFSSTGGPRVILQLDVHVVGRHFHLDADFGRDNTCATGGSGPVAAFSVHSLGSVDITLGDDFQVMSATPGAMQPASVSGLESCVVCTSISATTTTGMSITSVTGGWDGVRHRLHFVLVGQWSDWPGFDLVGGCGSTTTTPHPELREPLEAFGPLLYFDGHDGELLDTRSMMPTTTAGGLLTLHLLP